MERKSRPLIFVGYCEDVKSYGLFDSNSREVFFRRDVQFDERYPPMEPPSPASPSLPSTSSSLQGYLSFEDDVDIVAPPFTPPPDVPQVPKWARDTVDAAGTLVGDPTDVRRTCSQTIGSGLLSHAISNDP